MGLWTSYLMPLRLALKTRCCIGQIRWRISSNGVSVQSDRTEYIVLRNLIGTSLLRTKCVALRFRLSPTSFFGGLLNLGGLLLLVTFAFGFDSSSRRNNGQT